MTLAVAATMILVVGASRLYLGVHWLTDVLGGYALGGIWLALLLAHRLRHGHTVQQENAVVADGKMQVAGPC